MGPSYKAWGFFFFIYFLRHKAAHGLQTWAVYNKVTKSVRKAMNLDICTLQNWHEKTLTTLLRHL